ncbi:MAG: heavy metal-binding domain-containing protein [Pirellulales bacterium]
MNEAPPSPSPPRPSPRFEVLRTALAVAWVRLRFLGVFLLIFLLVAKWDDLGTLVDRLGRSLRQAGGAPQAVSSDTEYFCPMCPGVLSEWPAKCPVCNMPLVRRAKGEAAILPSGVVARMRLSPYRLQLAGVQTSEVRYRPLSYEVLEPGERLPPESNGSGADAPRMTAPLSPRDRSIVHAGVRGEVRVEGGEPLPATVEAVATDEAGLAHAVVRVDRPASLPSAAPVRLTVPVAETIPFRDQPRGVPAPEPGELRRVYVCPDHADVVATAAGVCPRDDLPLAMRELAAHERLRWACREHVGDLSAAPHQPCKQCDDQRLPSIVAYAPVGEVLAVPFTAVLDSGKHILVYVESMPGMFDGVEIEVGSRAGDYYPVVRGLSAGQRVATAGAFLLDAETRLSPGLASTYFGAGAAAGSAPQPTPAAATAKLDGLDLSPADRALAEAQRVCPVTKLPLGSMGPLLRLETDGKPVFLCCPACRGRYEAQQKTEK